MNKPNIVFILVDDHAPHAISAYGSVVNTTPNIDRIATEGALLEAMFCTNSICTPSRASILTGTYSHVNGVPSIFSEMDYRVPTFVDVLHGAGYATAMFGKWHLGESARSNPRAFDEWLVFPGQGEYNDPVMIGPDGERTMPGYATDIVTDISLDWLDRHRAAQAESFSQKPFALFVHHKAPHSPWVPDPKHADLYPIGSIPEPVTLHDQHESLGEWASRTTMSIADDITEYHLKEPVPAELEGDDKREERASWKYQRYMRDYLQCIHSIDENVARILERLDETGEAENTIVVYASDQGFFLGDHGWFDKRLMFEQSLQMPVLFRWPNGIRPGTRVEQMVTNVDFAATLLEMCGFAPDDSLPTSQGTSFAGLLGGEQADEWAESMYYRYWENDDPNHHAPAHYGVRTRTHKLICYYGASLGVPGASERTFPVEWELFDLVADPAELHNVIDDPANAEIIVELKAELARLQDKYGDQPYEGPETTHPDWADGLQQFS